MSTQIEIKKEIKVLKKNINKLWKLIQLDQFNSTDMECLMFIDCCWQLGLRFRIFCDFFIFGYYDFGKRNSVSERGVNHVLQELKKKMIKINFLCVLNRFDVLISKIIF